MGAARAFSTPLPRPCCVTVLLSTCSPLSSAQFYQQLPPTAITDEYLWGRLEPLLSYMSAGERDKVNKREEREAIWTQARLVSADAWQGEKVAGARRGKGLGTPRLAPLVRGQAAPSNWLAIAPQLGGLRGDGAPRRGVV